MGKFLILVGLTLGLYSAQSAQIISTSSCKCWKDYQPEMGDSGLQCVALDQFHIMPCNMPRLPKCECSGGVSNILKDKTGTWCTKYSKGEELMRWPCENTKEWDEFFKKNPNLVIDRYELCKRTNPPKCLCSGELSSIVKDRSGAWCIKYNSRLEEKRWPCENHEEWVKFWSIYPHYAFC